MAEGRGNVRKYRRRMRRTARALAAKLIPRPMKEMVKSALRRRQTLQSYQTPLVPAAELEEVLVQALHKLHQHGADWAGDYLEFGVCHGTSMRCMFRALQRKPDADYRMFGFDSFEGLPDEARDDGGPWQPGQFDSDEAETRRLLTAEGIDWSRTFLTKGWFKETLNSKLVDRFHMAGRATIVMVDCDIFVSARESLEFCAATLSDRAIVFFDDWHSDALAARNLGERRAFEEFMADHPEFAATRCPGLRYNSNCEVYLLTRLGT